MNTEKAEDLIKLERQRQITLEGYDSANDDRYVFNELNLAGLCYLNHVQMTLGGVVCAGVPKEWPFARIYWKPTADLTRALVKAGALFQAELDRLKRQRLKQPVENISFWGVRLNLNCVVNLLARLLDGPEKWNPPAFPEKEGLTLTAVHTGDGWLLQYENVETGEFEPEEGLPWPEDRPASVDTAFLESQGFTVV